MSYLKKILTRFSVYFLITFSLLCLVFYIAVFNNYSKERCEKIRNIAINEEKIRYIRDWLDENINSKDFLNLFGQTGRLWMQDSPRDFRKLNLDWDYLGMDINYGRVSLVRNKMGADNHSAPSQFDRFKIGEGRNAIIISLTGENDMASYDKNRQYTQIDKGIYVYCD